MIINENINILTQLIKIFIFPEIEKRRVDGRITTPNTIDLHSFRIYQIKQKDNTILSIVELNEEAQPLFAIKQQKQLTENELQKMVGLNLGLSDIAENECYILPPEVEGKKCAYFYFHRMFLNPLITFDCSPNIPGINEDELKSLNNRFPLKEQVANLLFLQKLKANEKFKLLAENNWPPSPGFYPNILTAIVHKPDIVLKEEFCSLVIANFDNGYWENQIVLWEYLGLFSKRMKYVKAAIDSYLQGNYICSIYTICPQIEGIINYYLDETDQKKSKPRDNIDTLRSLLYSRKIFINPRMLIDIMLEFLKDSTFFKGHSSDKNAAKQICRHGVTHGVFYDFESQEISLKYLLLLDALAFVILSDKIVVNASK